MPEFNPEDDKVLHEVGAFEKPPSKSVRVRICSYNTGPPKVACNRHWVTNKGVEKTSSLGRLTKSEAQALSGLLLKAAELISG
jgi:hypothetical protein